MLSQLPTFSTAGLASLLNWQVTEPSPPKRADLHTLWQSDRRAIPTFVQESAAAMKYLELLGPLDWHNFPERDESCRAWPGTKPAPRAPFVAAYLVKLDKGLPSMPKLYDELLEQPALVWLLGFPLMESDDYSWGFDVEQSLCTVKHFSRILRELDNDKLQFLLNGTVHLLQSELSGVELPDGTVLDESLFGNEISLDTKHIIAWVVENNPKERMSDRYVKENQPKGDLDCKLGCKERKNQKSAKKTHDGSKNTPTQEGMPGSKKSLGEFYWGYNSGVVATKIPNWVEIVLAERTATFDKSDISFFKPLMEQTENVLGRAPRYGAFDAAFDAHYVYEYFHNAGGAAIVPLRNKNSLRTFNADGVPLCAAELPFALKYTYTKRSNTLYPHKRERYACPLLHPEKCADCCPIDDPHWKKGGCTADIPQSIGSRIRVQIDRESTEFKERYKQRTATERVNSQAFNLGIERPKLRNQGSITNQNTLIYVLINLRALQRVKKRKANSLS